MVSGRFAPVSPLTLKTIAGYNEGKKVNMMFAGAFINAESAKLGYLLSKLADGGRHYSFFGNSTQEAVAGAVKLARHNSVRAKRDDGGWILFVDGSDYFQPYLDPLGAGEEESIAPHLAFVSSLEEALGRVGEQKWAAVLLVRTQETEREPEKCKRLLDEAGGQGALRIVCSSEIEPSPERLFASELPADVHVLGENLTGREVPFGCFVMSSKAYSVWNNPTDSLAHTSTFGGNGICLAVALDVLRRAGFVTDEDEQLFSRIDEDADTRSRYFRRHVNPGAADGMRTFGFDLDIDKADGGRLTLTDGRVLLDCCGGTGASLRGHNPPDLVPEVLNTHEEHHDYFADLEELIGDVSRFPHALPAVSGATAVEIALTMALLANPTRTKVVTFKGNYSGKSLVSLNLSKYGPTAASTDRDAFRPYYFDLVYLDPFQPGAAAQLAELLRGDDVAVVWFEYTQGMLCRPLPDDVIRVVNELKREHGYLIGVDEVLSGAWRSGEHFLAHHDKVPECDISTLAKPLSDMTLPMGATLVTAEVLTRARETDADHVERLQHHYRNGIAAHIAFHAFTWALDPARQDRRLLQQKRLRAAMDELAAESRLFESAAGMGAHIRLVPKRRWFPFKSRSILNQMLECSMQNLFLTRTGVLLGQQRFFHGIFADDEDVEAAIVRLRALSGIHPLAVYWNVVTCIYQAFKVSRAKKRKRKP